MVEVGTGGISSKYIKEEWPIEEGLTAGTTKTSGKQTNLVAEEGSNVSAKERTLI